jgi:colanic acid/amylovoran biosynthesis protein
MLIELEGVEFKNKGSELMLRTIIQEIGNGVSEAEFALRPRSDRPFLKRAELGLYQKLEFRKLGVDWGI